ncbi:acrylate utilization transcriptional regulator AcuR [Vibrio salinus]|uniref:acrylate utilization transcriptional regulator AcuR n=1 Tax=Vibrio salinus TaxID=2899784 RepID=UPI001E44E3A5|nr:TetR/AcrR family transcriptional regulator [Vibrio salinus]MCE0495037.1 TetR/AcrR family transcriptional regulator [Vibrio salinus]
MAETNIAPKRKRGRPPKTERGFADTKKALLRSGVELITENGFMSSGIDTIVKRVGVPKGSFYHYFKNKEEFGQEVVAEYGRYFSKKLEKHFSRQDVCPLDRIELFVEDAKVGMTKFNFKRGCLVGNMMQESPQLSEACARQLQLAISDWKSKVKNCLTEGQKTLQIKPDIETEFYASQFWSGWEGAVMRAKLFRSTAPLDEFWSFFSQAVKVKSDTTHD